jgi:hypothetical protein
MRANGIGGIALALGLAATSCTGPALTSSAYASKAANTAEAVVSAARTVLIAARTGDDGDSFSRTIAVAVEEAEADAGAARDTFASIQPPDEAADELRAALLPTVERAVDVIGQVRIAARRADPNLSAIAAPLDELADALDAFASRYG